MKHIKNILLLGTSFSALPLANRIKNKNYNLITVGINKNEAAHQISDMQIYTDYSNIKELEKAVKHLNIDAIVPSCNDYAYSSATKLANILKIDFPDSEDTVNLLHKKSNFKKLIRNLNIDHALQIDDIDNRETTVIVKPIDSFSGKGCSVVKPKEEIRLAIDKALKSSSSKKYLVEEFIDGTLHSVSSFIDKGKIVQNFIADEFCLQNPYAVSFSQTPSSVENKFIKKMININNKIIVSTGLFNGLLHTQFIIKDNRVVIIESMRRAPGDLLGQQHFFSSGHDYWAYYLSGFIKDFKQTNYFKAPKRYFVTREIVATKESTFFECINFLSEGNNKSSTIFVPLLASGNLVEQHPHGKIGILFNINATKEIKNNTLLQNNDKKYKL